jgi:hypothetical protein
LRTLQAPELPSNIVIVQEAQCCFGSRRCRLAAFVGGC